MEKPPTENVDAYQIYLRSRELSAVDRSQNLEAINLLEEAAALDPDFSLARAQMAYRLLFLSHYDDRKYLERGLEVARSVVRDDPALAYGHFEAEALVETLPRGVAGVGASWLLPESRKARYGYLLAQRGEMQEAKQMLEEARRAAQEELASGNELPRVAMEMAAIRAARKEMEDSLDWLSRAYDSGYREYGMLLRDPIFGSFRERPEFQTLVGKMETDVASMRQRAIDRGLYDFEALLSPRSRP